MTTSTRKTPQGFKRTATLRKRHRKPAPTDTMQKRLKTNTPPKGTHAGTGNDEETENKINDNEVGNESLAKGKVITKDDTPVNDEGNSSNDNAAEDDSIINREINVTDSTLATNTSNSGSTTATKDGEETTASSAPLTQAPTDNETEESLNITVSDEGEWKKVLSKKSRKNATKSSPALGKTSSNEEAKSNLENLFSDFQEKTDDKINLEPNKENNHKETLDHAGSLVNTATTTLPSTPVEKTTTATTLVSPPSKHPSFNPFQWDQLESVEAYFVNTVESYAGSNYIGRHNPPPDFLVTAKEIEKIRQPVVNIVRNKITTAESKGAKSTQMRNIWTKLHLAKFKDYIDTLNNDCEAYLNSTEINSIFKPIPA